MLMTCTLSAFEMIFQQGFSLMLSWAFGLLLGVLPEVKTVRPGEEGARFQLTATDLAVQLVAPRRAGLGGVGASFYHPGAQGQGWELALQGLAWELWGRA